MIAKCRFHKLFILIILAAVPLGCRAESYAANVEYAKLPADADLKQTPFPATKKPSERGKFQTVSIGEKETPILVSRVVVDGKPIGYGIYAKTSLSATGVIKYIGQGEGGLHVVFTAPDHYGVSNPFGSMSLFYLGEDLRISGASYSFQPSSQTRPDLLIENRNANGELNGNQTAIMKDGIGSRQRRTLFKNGTEVAPTVDDPNSFTIEGGYYFKAETLVSSESELQGSRISWINPASNKAFGRGLSVIVMKVGGTMLYADSDHKVSGDGVIFRNFAESGKKIAIIGPCSQERPDVTNGFSWVLRGEESISYGKINMGNPEGEWIFYYPTCNVIGESDNQLKPFGKVRIIYHDGKTKEVDIGAMGIDAYLQTK